MQRLEVTWTQLKSFLDDRFIKCQFVEFDNMYIISGIDGPFSLSTRLLKVSPASADQTDFETNYKTVGNSKITPTDVDGAPLQRTKVTKTGWHFQAQAIEFITSKLNSLYNKDMAGADLGFTAIKYYDSSDDELVAPSQATLDTDCVKTVVSWEPTVDYEIIGGTLYQSAAPSNDVRIWIIAVPDVPAIYGGSIPFAEGGLNLKHMGAGAIMELDGKTPKLMSYDATNHTGKFQLIVKHDAGDKNPLMLVFKIFEA